MKRLEQNVHLRIHPIPAEKVTAVSRIFTQKNMDRAVVITSIAGLISAAAFLLTMS